jgi:hypothetical protein
MHNNFKKLYLIFLEIFSKEKVIFKRKTFTLPNGKNLPQKKMVPNNVFEGFFFI